MLLVRLTSTLVAAFLVAGRAFAGDVITVSTAGPADFTQIQPAVDAALDGDTILVKSGSYAAFTVEDKGLTIVGDSTALVPVAGTVRIRNLALGKTLTLACLDVEGVDVAGQKSALDVFQCAGSVRIVQCEFTGRTGSSTAGGLGGEGVHVVGASDLALAATTLRGGAGLSGFTCLFDLVGMGSSALFLRNTTCALYECVASGGHGGDGGDRTGMGGAGIWVNDLQGSSIVFASRSVIAGGRGGNTDCPSFGCPNHGGGGFVSGQSTIVQTLDTSVAGGAAGIGNPSCPAEAGEAFEGVAPFTYTVSSLGFSMPAVAREGAVVTIAFAGTPGDAVYLNDELTTTFQGMPSWRGVLLSPFHTVDHPGAARIRRWGIVPASGVLTKSYTVPMLPAGEEAQTRFLQVYRLGGTGLTLGSFATLTVVDAAF